MAIVCCPIGTCRAENEAWATTCVSCGIPLREYIHLSTYPAQLFNDGLKATQTGNISKARDLFAAVVYWCPRDIEARNALAMACFTLGDRVEAHYHWRIVIEQSARNMLAQQGLTALANQPLYSPDGPRPRRARRRNQRRIKAHKKHLLQKR